MIDLAIVIAYFVIIFVIGLRARADAHVGPEEYFLSSRSLRWPSIAMSTIATNIEAGHFLSVTGAAYVGGLAQGNFELNAIFGIVIAAFFFVPLYLRLKVVTISQFFEQRFGPRIALAYALLMIVLYALLYLGTALFWAAYALDGLFSEMVAWISDRRSGAARGSDRRPWDILGGLHVSLADCAPWYGPTSSQCVLLLGGGLITVTVAVHHLGGWSELFGTTGHLMHLHLPRDHPTVPWTALIGMNLAEPELLGREPGHPAAGPGSEESMARPSRAVSGRGSQVRHAAHHRHPRDRSGRHPGRRTPRRPGHRIHDHRHPVPPSRPARPHRLRALRLPDEHGRLDL